MTEPVLAKGCYRLPTGTLANVVTCLEMTAGWPSGTKEGAQFSIPAMR